MLLSAALLSGCCANNVCDCNDQHADAFYFQFPVASGADSLTGPAFARSTVDTVYLLRYPRTGTLIGTTAHDSIALLPTATRRPGSPFFIDNNAPFALVSGRKLNSFEYVLMVRDRRIADRSRQLLRYVVSDIHLQGSFEGNGCCTCYVNYGKSLRVTTATSDSTYVATTTSQQPVVIVLSR